ncbi:MAG: hypothetical protein RLZZ11_1660, partial [Cyanobacteriota bacterium]
LARLDLSRLRIAPAPLMAAVGLSTWVLAGIGLGRFSWAADDVLPGDFTLEEILLERLLPLGVPLVRHLPVGHGRPNLALPVGRMAQLDGRSGELSLITA